MKKILHLFKAQPLGDDKIEDTTIILEHTFPKLEDLDSECKMIESDRLFEADSKALEAILHDTLPGGTYDRLLAEMLDRRKSHFIVPFGGQQK